LRGMDQEQTLSKKTKFGFGIGGGSQWPRGGGAGKVNPRFLAVLWKTHGEQMVDF